MRSYFEQDTLEAAALVFINKANQKRRINFQNSLPDS